MPIDYKKYPENWKTEIRPAILKRAGHKCEFCGAPNHHTIVRHGDQFEIIEGMVLEAMAIDGVKTTWIVLTIAHMDHDITNNHPDNLKALCQKCHLNHDKLQHKLTRESKKSLMLF